LSRANTLSTLKVVASYSLFALRLISCLRRYPHNPTRRTTLALVASNPFYIELTVGVSLEPALALLSSEITPEEA
jgi:hypothetical protein